MARVIATIAILIIAIVSSVGWYLTSTQLEESQKFHSLDKAELKKSKKIILDIYDDSEKDSHELLITAYINRAKGRPGTANALALLNGNSFDVVRANLYIAKGIQQCADIDIKNVETYFKEIAKRIKMELKYLEPTPQAQQMIKEKGRVEFYISCANNVVSKDFKLQYVDDDKVDSTLPWHMFLHGISEKKKGTCNTMAVAWKVIGDELRWPLHIRTIKNHCYIAWDDGKFETNIETTDLAGYVSDEDYMKSGSVTEAERKAGIWMSNLSNKQMLALFLSNRADYFHAVGDFKRAFEDLLLASQLDEKGVYSRMLLAQFWPDISPHIAADLQAEFEHLLGPEITQYGKKFYQQKQAQKAKVLQNQQRVQRIQDQVRSGAVKNKANEGLSP